VRSRESLISFPLWQAGEPLLLENGGDRGDAQALSLLCEETSDVVDGEIMLSQSDNLLTDRVLLGRFFWARIRGEEELPVIVMAKLVAEDTEASRGIAEALGHLVRGESLDEVSSEGLVLTVSGVFWFEESPGLFT
jgi:hypothetical protein